MNEQYYNKNEYLRMQMVQEHQIPNYKIWRKKDKLKKKIK